MVLRSLVSFVADMKADLYMPEEPVSCEDFSPELGVD
jgi:hypothetical protein